MNKNVMSSLKPGVIGGALGFFLIFLFNYYVFPLPETVSANAIGNGMSGLISGFFGGFMGVLMYLREHVKSTVTQHSN